MATQLDMAEQQLWGWHAAQAGERLPALVSGMGLTYKEWDALRASGAIHYLTDYEKEEIEQYFCQYPHDSIISNKTKSR